jgi:hypothetical protein
MLDSKGTGATAATHKGTSQQNGAAQEAPDAEEPTPDTTFREEDINPEEIPF